MRLMRFLLLLLLSFLAPFAYAWQPSGVEPAEPTREFRAVWVATVFNLDWPSRSGLSAAAQKEQLLKIINTASKLKLNAIILQVRPNGDALYRSSYEPWSVWLSGAGIDPGYDPLAFAVTEAHRRGIELHAWFNPFRANVSGKPVGRGHVTQTMPSHVLKAGSTSMLNPSAGTAQNHVLKVILDVVRRYDIDGVHLDDYFYPYPPNTLRDGKSPAQRRAAIDSFVYSLYKQVKAQKPWVRVGISPFGIWQPGYPSGVEAGVNAYEQLACDARKWLQQGWVDYLAPQLYWRCEGPQSYPALLKWWGAINTRRPVWPGIASARINSKEDPGRTAAEIAKQIDYSRTLARQSAGQLFWSWRSIGNNTGNIQAYLKQRYTSCALPPAMPWSGSAKPAQPRLSMQMTQAGCKLQWQPSDQSARRWIVQARIKGYWYTLCVLPGGSRGISLPANLVQQADYIALRGISACGNSGSAAVMQR